MIHDPSIYVLTAIAFYDEKGKGQRNFFDVSCSECWYLSLTLIGFVFIISSRLQLSVKQGARY